jgi:error-prone DNA polymerase
LLQQWSSGQRQLQLDVLPALTRAEALAWEHDILGLSPGDHILALYRSRLAEQGILSTVNLAGQPHGRRVTVAGLVVVHQAPPTAKNFHFLTLEDEHHLIDVIVRPHIYIRYRRLLHTTPLLLVKGTVQRENGVINILAEGMEALNW